MVRHTLLLYTPEFLLFDFIVRINEYSQEHLKTMLRPHHMASTLSIYLTLLASLLLPALAEPTTTHGPTHTVHTVHTITSTSTGSSLPPSTVVVTHRTTLSTSVDKATHSTSVIQATRVETGYASATPSVAYDGGTSKSGSFSMSQGGLIAIIVVVVCVAIFGITSIVLFVLAKRRQWNVRASLKRASKRLTAKGREDAARRKRSGIAAPNGTPRVGGDGRGQKRGTVVEVKDEEGGAVEYGMEPKAIESSWVKRLWRNDWK